MSVCAVATHKWNISLVQCEETTKKEFEEKRDDDDDGDYHRAVNRRLWLQVQSDYIRIYISTLIYVSASHFSSSRASSGRRLATFFLRIQFFILLNDFGSQLFFFSLGCTLVHSLVLLLCVWENRVLCWNLVWNPLSQSHHSTHMQIERKYTSKIRFLQIRARKKNAQLLINLNELAPFFFIY